MWLLLGLLSGFTDAVRNVLAKHNTNTYNSLVVTWAITTYSLIILIPLMFVKGIPSLDGIFWLALSARTVLDVIATILYVKALKYTDLSLSLPLLSLTPLLLLFTGLLINHEFPGPTGVGGVVAIVVGTYSLYFTRKEKFYQPFLALYQNKGARMMLGVAVLWSITSPLHRLAILHSNPYFYTGFGTLVIAAIFTLMILVSDRKGLKSSLKPKNVSKLAPAGLIGGVSVLAQMIGLSIAPAVLIQSLKRTSIIFSSIMGGVFFGEPLKKRIAPICLMVFGVILISLS